MIRSTASSGGLRRCSFALLDQILTIDKRRVRKVFGKISTDELEAIDDGLALLLGLRLRG